MITIFENFKDIYKIDTDKEVVIKAEYLDKVEFINKNRWSGANLDLADRYERQKKYKGKVCKMKYNYRDDFFCEITFDDGETRTIPVYMLIHKDEYDLLNNMKKYNL